MVIRLERGADLHTTPHLGLGDAAAIWSGFWSRDLRSFDIRFEFESAVPIRFDSTVMGRFEKCLPIARSSQTTQTINGA